MIVLLVALAGLVVGAGGTWWLLRRAATPVTSPGLVTTDDGDRAPSWDVVVDRLTLGVVVAGPGGRVRYRNPASRALSGTHLGLLVDAAIERLVGRALRGESAREDLELYGPPRLAVVVTSSPLDGGGAIVTIEDISERRRVDAVRTDFVANISHELKTPVGALAVLAETLIDEEDPTIVHRVAGRMVDEAMRVSRTIDDLLELSRIELGEEPRLDVVDVVAVVDEAVDRTRQLAEARRISVDALELPTGVRVDGDRRQLVSALGNLLENAMKYSEPGSSVQVRARVEGTWAELMVADHGIGIPASEHGRIFERFYRVDKARSRDTGGTGLGLAIVRHVATNHHGQVLVSSQEGEGSTFVLRLPLAPAPADAPADAPAEQDESADRTVS
ncbi:MAG: sensor histidine kinase [Ilumatobacteraceae bacterium]